MGISYKESLARMDVLKQQHRDWQAAVEELLRTVEHVSRFNGDAARCKSQEAKLAWKWKNTVCRGKWPSQGPFYFSSECTC